jgi:hypothetical protein
VVGEYVTERTQYLGNQIPSLRIAAAPERAAQVEWIR